MRFDLLVGLVLSCELLFAEAVPSTDQTFLDWFYRYKGQGNFSIHSTICPLSSSNDSQCRSMYHSMTSSRISTVSIEAAQPATQAAFFFVPVKLTISGQVASVSPFVQHIEMLLNESLSGMWKVALFIFHEKYIARHSFYKPYLDILPVSFPGMPYTWLSAPSETAAPSGAHTHSTSQENTQPTDPYLSENTSDYAFLNDLLQYTPSYFRDAMTYKKRIDAVILALTPAINHISQAYDISPETIRRGVIWSWLVVQSRAFGILNAYGEKDVVLIPYADIFNGDLCSSAVHPIAKQLKFSTLLMGYTTTPSAHESLSGSEAYITYGEMSSSSAMNHYGLSPWCFYGLDTVRVVARGHVGGCGIGNGIADTCCCSADYATAVSTVPQMIQFVRRHYQLLFGVPYATDSGGGGTSTIPPDTAAADGVGRGHVVESVHLNISTGELILTSILSALRTTTTSTTPFGSSTVTDHPRIILPPAMLNAVKLMCIQTTDEIHILQQFEEDVLIHTPSTHVPTTHVTNTISLPMLSMRNQMQALRYLRDILQGQLHAYPNPLYHSGSETSTQARITASYLTSIEDERVCTNLLRTISHHTHTGPRNDGREVDDSNSDGEHSDDEVYGRHYAARELVDLNSYCELPKYVRNSYLDFVSGERAVWAQRRGEMRLIKAALRAVQAMLEEVDVVPLYHRQRP